MSRVVQTIPASEVLLAHLPGRDSEWVRVRQHIRTDVGEEAFNSWFGRVELKSVKEHLVTLSVPTRFIKSWLTRYADTMLRCWQSERPEVTRVEVVVRTIGQRAPA